MTGPLLKISPTGIALIKYFQGLSLEKYRDESGLWVIGFGHIISQPDISPRIITSAQAERLLHDDIFQCEAFLRKIIPTALPQEKHDALVSLIFSCGASGCLKTGILQEVAQGRYAEATSLWRNALTLNGKKIESLAAQRQAECALFNAGIADYAARV
ncbi:lysozyme [Enterobacter soli]|uniref:lysozyme n=1 Tax=Enterobacter soli TaxID=885040 RepID=UPI0034CF8783